MVQEMVQNVLVYVVMTTILRGLVSDKGFLEIFRFVSGLILILLFISPILSVLSLDAGWFQKLEKNIFQVDKRQLEQEMRVADGSFKKVLRRECEQKLKKQMRKMARENGQLSQEVEVSLEEGENGTWSIGRIHMTVGQGSQEAMSHSDGNARQDGDAAQGRKISEIKKIVVGPGRGETIQEQKGAFCEDRDTRLLKKKICQKYQLSQEVVDVWKINGEY